jgi:hypothetical protein
MVKTVRLFDCKTESATRQLSECSKMKVEMERRDEECRVKNHCYVQLLRDCLQTDTAE